MCEPWIIPGEESCTNEHMVFLKDGLKNSVRVALNSLDVLKPLLQSAKICWPQLPLLPCSHYQLLSTSDPSIGQYFLLLQDLSDSTDSGDSKWFLIIIIFFPLLIYLPTFNWVPCHQSFLNVTFSKLHCRKTNVRIPVRRFLVPSPTSRMHKLQGCHIDSCQHFQDKLCSQNWERIEKQGKIKDTGQKRPLHYWRAFGW